MRKLLAAALFAVGLTACVGPVAPISNAQNDQAGLVYGYVNGNLGVPNITLYNTKTKVMAPWVKGNEPAHRFSSGLIVFDNVTPGDYLIHGFGIGQTAYSLGQDRILVTVRPGEIVYLGAFEYANTPGLFSSSFTFTPTSDPSDGTVLNWAIEATADTDWSQRLRERPRTAPSSWTPVSN